MSDLVSSVVVKIKRFIKRKDADNNVKPWIRWYSRIGFSAKGSVYILIGLLSMMTAVGIGKKNGQQGAIASIASKPFGEIILWLLILGLTGYLTWLITQVIIEPDHNGSVLKGFFIRLGYFFAASFYVGLGVKFSYIAIHSGDSGHSTQFWMGKILDTTIGRLVVGATGVGILVFAIIQVIIGVTGAYTRKLKTTHIKPRVWLLIKQIGRVGFIARGVIFGVLGTFLVHSGWTSEKSQATGIDGALAQIAQEHYGQLFLGVISLGLFFYGIFEVLEGINRNIKVK